MPDSGSGRLSFSGVVFGSETARFPALEFCFLTGRRAARLLRDVNAAETESGAEPHTGGGVGAGTGLFGGAEHPPIRALGFFHCTSDRQRAGGRALRRGRGRSRGGGDAAPTTHCNRAVVIRFEHFRIEPSCGAPLCG